MGVDVGRERRVEVEDFVATVVLPVDIPDPWSVQLAFRVEDEQELRTLVDRLGGIGEWSWHPDHAMLSRYHSPAEGVQLVVYVHLAGALKPPKVERPASVVERLRAEAEERKQREPDSEVVGAHDVTAGEVRSWEGEPEDRRAEGEARDV